MVSTRRTAGTDSEPISAIENGQALRKKPVRKATAKAEPVKTRATRTRKPDVATKSEPAVVEEADDVEVAPPVSKPQVAGLKVSSRVKKPKASPIISPPQVIQLAEPGEIVRSTRLGISRSKKADIHVERAAEEAAAAPVQPPPTRITRRTRGTTSGSTPLSPKKVSQISKGRSYNARPAKDPNRKTNSASDIAKARVATRSRTVSDENNHPEELQQTNDDDEIVVRSSRAAETRSGITGLRNNRTVPRSENSMRSKSTTSPHRSVMSLCSTQHEIGNENDEILDDDSKMDANNEESEQLDPSDDELAGPKTPMKRSSPGAHARYLASVQKTVRVLDEERVQYSQPRNTSSAPKRFRLATRFDPTSEVRQAISARTHNHDATSQMNPPCQAPEVADDEKMEDEEADTEDERSVENRGADQGDVSHLDDSLLLDTPFRTRRLSSIVCSLHAEDSIMDYGAPRTSDADTGTGDKDEDEDEDVEMPNITNIETDEDHESDRLVLDVSDHEKVDDHADDISVIDSEDTVIMTNTVDDTISSQSLLNHSSIGDDLLFSNVPETLIWDSIRKDITIPINFDAHLSGIRESTRLNQNQYLSETMELAPSLECATEQKEAAKITCSPVEMMDGVGETQFASSAQARRTTLDTFNDFVDVNAGDRQTDLVQVNSAAEQSQDLHDHMELTETELLKGAVLVKLQDERRLHESCIVDSDLPHYALPTIAFHARRKSLPATSISTPVRFHARPNTSDGTSVSRPVTVDRQAWWARVASAQGTPIRPQSNLLFDTTRTAHNETQTRCMQSQVSTRHASFPVRLTTPVSRSGRRRVPDNHANTVAPSRRFRTPVSTPVKRPLTSHKPVATGGTPRTLSLKSRRSQVYEVQDDVEDTQRLMTSLQIVAPVAVTTPLASRNECVSWSGIRKPHGELARTLAATRYRTPTQAPPKRPVTAAKPATSRKVTFSARTPVKTPLKGLSTTPGQVPMTPHPAAPLKDVVALVEIFTLEGASASAPFIALLQRLGAKAQKSWSERITHVVFKDGSPRTLQKLRQHNQDVERSDVGIAIHCVNSRWVSDCDAAGSRMPEADEAYAVDPTVLPRGGSRRRKSMEPYALININGNVVRDRKSSLGRRSLSLARSPLEAVVATPSEKALHDGTAAVDTTSGGHVNVEEQENTDVELDDPALSSPATPAWLHPEQLVQQTAPLQRIRKFDLKGTKPVKRRRLTFWVNDA